MKSYSLEIEIDVPRSRVAELFGDPENLAFWQPGFQSIEPVDETPESGAGSQHLLTYLHGKRNVEMIETIEVDNLPEEFTANYVAPGVEIRVRNRFEELGAEKTRWISDNEGKTSGIIMKIFSILMPGCFKKESFKYMVNFKAFAETGADVREEK